ncbi:MAG: hypothetical protein FJ388_19490 [Verrucomicrobia bacterium]|nr:hypothetical protein [Verrucomicrobiota bacterium]
MANGSLPPRGIRAPQQKIFPRSSQPRRLFEDFVGQVANRQPVRVWLPRAQFMAFFAAGAIPCHESFRRRGVRVSREGKRSARGGKFLARGGKPSPRETKS